jgi:CheY-like chemotaxis protein
MSPSAPSVLVVDDCADSADSLATLLELHGFPARAVTDGADAIQSAVTNPPDVVVLDLLMPGLDGWEVARQLRSCGTPKLPFIVALTGRDTAPDRRQAQEAGIDLYLRKPVEPADFIAILKSLPARQSPDAA